MHVHISICFGAKILQWWFTLDLWTSGKFACWEIHVLMLFPCTFCLNIHTLVQTWMHTRICILVKKDIANDGLHLISELQVSSIVAKHMYWCAVLAPCVRTHTHTLPCKYLYVFVLGIANDGLHLISELQVSSCWQVHVLMLSPCTFCLNISTHTHIYLYICSMYKTEDKVREMEEGRCHNFFWS